MTFLELICLLAFPSPEHENMRNGLFKQIDNYLEDNNSPHSVHHTMGVVMSPYFPDILELKAFQKHFKENIKKGTEKDVYLVPDLFIAFDYKREDFCANGYSKVPKMVIEIVSPSTAGKDYGNKKELYRYIGVEEYWIINDSENVIVNLLEDGNYQEIEYYLEEMDKDSHKGYLEIEVKVLPGLVIEFSKKKLRLRS